MTFETILFQKNGSITHLVLNRPAVFNALNQTLLQELNQAILHCKNDDDNRVVIISGGESKAFCSGADLKSGLTDSNLGNTLRATYNPLITNMRALEKPIICQLNGVAAGAGMSLALACDLIVASEEAYLTELFVSIGLMPDAGSMYFLPRLIGMQKTFELCSTGRKVFMPEALELGLVTKVVPHTSLAHETQTIAENYAKAATRSIGLMKQVLNKTYQSTLEQVLELEAQAQTQCGYTGDFAEGVMAFLTKKSPNFKGK
jgi:2-(1,2-epoxy-1,2-dihydrophenyl)acetyl-CoA isomerase